MKQIFNEHLQFQYVYKLNQIEQEIKINIYHLNDKLQIVYLKQQTSNSTTAKHTYQGKRMTIKRGLKSKSTSNTKSKLTNKTPRTKNSRIRNIHDILKGAEEFLIIISDESESKEKVTPAAQSQFTEPHTSPVDTAVQSGPSKRPPSPTPSIHYFISRHNGKRFKLNTTHPPKTTTDIGGEDYMEIDLIEEIPNNNLEYDMDIDNGGENPIKRQITFRQFISRYKQIYNINRI
ncbi:hypothetical protein B5S29_g5839 [[Candida] boidinii]|nr:hypothetical protein B5S29_g5839 [[Candida] boidinii]